MKSPAFRAYRLTVEIVLLFLVVLLTLQVVEQKQQIEKQDAKIEQLVRDKLVLIQDYQALQKQANLPASGGY